MGQHGFNGIPDFLGASLPYFTTHMELVCISHAEAVTQQHALPCWECSSRVHSAWVCLAGSARALALVTLC